MIKFMWALKRQRMPLRGIAIGLGTGIMLTVGIPTIYHLMVH